MEYIDHVQRMREAIEEEICQNQTPASYQTAGVHILAVKENSLIMEYLLIPQCFKSSWVQAWTQTDFWLVEFLTYGLSFLNINTVHRGLGLGLVDTNWLIGFSNLEYICIKWWPLFSLMFILYCILCMQEEAVMYIFLYYSFNQLTGWNHF